MKKTAFLFTLAILIGAFLVVRAMTMNEENNISQPTTISKTTPPASLAPVTITLKGVNLQVPYTSETPDGQWVKPWNNACEEASIVMVEAYYLNRDPISIDDAKQMMWPLFNWEDKQFGSNADTDAARTAKIINEYSSFDAEIKQNPTIDEIKDELRNGHPVISFHHGKELRNPHHRFRRDGSYYHVMVIVGFDDDAKEFIVNDSGTDNYPGLDYRYPYATIMDTLHDFNHQTHKADGAPTVLFTKPKVVVKTKDSHRIYLIKDNKRYYISHPRVFKNRHLNWSLVRIVERDWLNQYTDGTALTQ